MPRRHLEQLGLTPRHRDLDDGRMHYLDEGQGSPVLALHGNPTWCFIYRHLILALRDRRRVIAPDHLGFGLSSKPAKLPACSLAWHIDNLCQLVLGLDLQDLTLVLHDWGGPIGLGFAMRHPRRVRRLVVLNTWAFLTPAGGQLPELLELPRQPGVGERLLLSQNLLVEQGIPGGIHHRERVTEQLMAAYRAPFPTPESRQAILALVREIPGDSGGPAAEIIGRIQAWLPALRVPAAIIWGDRDPVFPPGLVDLWRLYLPGAEVHRLPRASHFLQEDEPQTISELVGRFLDGHQEEPRP